MFPISGWFALPCTPPALALRPGLHTAASGTTAEYHCAPHRLANNNRGSDVEAAMLTRAGEPETLVPK